MKLFNAVLLLSVLLVLGGCQTSFGKNPNEYADIQEAPPLLISPGTGPLSDRYNVPSVPGNNAQLVIDLDPPDFKTEE